MMTLHQNAGLIVFAKLPEKGKVKSRLRTEYSEDQVLAIYEAMLRDVLDSAASLNEQIPAVSIYWAGGLAGSDPPAEMVDQFPNFQHHVQQGDDLGARMYRALEQEFARGRKKIVLIASDCPTLSTEFVLRAFDLLETCDLVLGPSEDGGYYLIGVSRLTPYPFAGVDWGSSKVLEQTKALLERHDVRFTLLPTWYDLDRPEDLRRIDADSSESRRAKNLRAVLRKLTNNACPTETN